MAERADTVPAATYSEFMRRLNAEHQRRYMITVEDGGAAYDDFTDHFSRGDIPEQVSVRLGERYGLEDYSTEHAYMHGLPLRRARRA